LTTRNARTRSHNHDHEFIQSTKPHTPAEWLQPYHARRRPKTCFLSKPRQPSSAHLFDATLFIAMIVGIFLDLKTYMAGEVQNNLRPAH
jgi:hypothetical protein